MKIFIILGSHVVGGAVLLFFIVRLMIKRSRDREYMLERSREDATIINRIAESVKCVRRARDLYSGRIKDDEGDLSSILRDIEVNLKGIEVLLIHANTPKTKPCLEEGTYPLKPYLFQ